MKNDVGQCPICGAAHTACGRNTGPITSVMLPARDAVQSVTGAEWTVPLGDNTDGRFSTGTYRGKKKP